MASPDPAIRIEDLRFAYGERTILDQISLDVRPGEVVGLIGPNGSGKSTLIKLLSAVLPLGSGSKVALLGDDLSSLNRRQIAQRLAVVPQEPRFAFPFSALEVVLMGRHPHLSGLAFEAEEDIEIARSAMRRCGVDAFADRPVQQLSSGERQRVVFARALTQQPSILLLDEPASFLDIRHQVELYDLVRTEATERGVAVLSVLHDLNLAAEYCDRIALLSEGQLAANGPTDEVFSYSNLKRVFGTEVYVDTNSLTGKMLVVPLSGRAQRQLQRDPKGD
jgi:iron complex transport system ATP-binding protein